MLKELGSLDVHKLCFVSNIITLCCFKVLNLERNQMLGGIYHFQLPYTEAVQKRKLIVV